MNTIAEVAVRTWIALCLLLLPASLLASDEVAAAREYLAAIRKEPSSAQLNRIRQFSRVRGLPKEQKEEMRAIAAEAARLYASAHPDEWGAIALLVKLGDASADRMLSAWITTHEKDTDALLARGKLRFEAKRYLPAIGDFERAIEIDPDDPSRHYELASALLGAIMRDQAIEPAVRSQFILRAEAAFRRSAELDPKLIGARVGLRGVLKLRERSATTPEEKARITAEDGKLAEELEKLLPHTDTTVRVAALHIAQGMELISVHDRDVVTLQRQPFTLEYNITATVPVFLNVNTADTNQRLLDRGHEARKLCARVPAAWTYCPKNFAKEPPRNQQENLGIGYRLWHNLYYKSADDHAWSDPNDAGTGSYRRVVSKLDGTPIKERKEKELFFTSTIDLDQDGRVDAGELIRYTIRFK